MRNSTVQAALVLTAFQLASANPLANGFAGRWTLDRAASHFIGTAVTIQHLQHSYRFDLGGTTVEVGDDGGDYPTAPTRTTSFKQTGQDQWLRVHKLNGKTLDTSIFTMAPDGNSFAIQTTSGDGTGVRHISDETFLRARPGSGINGTWRSTKGGLNTPEVIDIRATGGGTLQVTCPDQQMTFTTPLDGSPVFYTGARAVPNVRIAVSRVSSTALHWTDLVSGRSYMEGMYSLSSDMRHLTVRSWHVTSPQEIDEAVYNREDVSTGTAP